MNSRFLLTIAIFLVAGLVAWFTFYATNETDDVGSGTVMTAVIVPTLGAQEAEGKTLFDSNCAKCHGVNAAGNSISGPPLVHIIYEPNHHSDAAFFQAAKIGTRAHHWQFGNMPPIQELTEQGVAKIIRYVRALQRANGIN